MEKEQPQLSRKPLRILTPPETEPSLPISLRVEDILTSEERRQRDVDLGNIAARRNIIPPDDIIVH